MNDIKEYLSHRQMDEEFEKASKEVERLYEDITHLQTQVTELEHSLKCAQEDCEHLDSAKSKVSLENRDLRNRLTALEARDRKLKEIEWIVGTCWSIEQAENNSDFLTAIFEAVQAKEQTNEVSAKADEAEPF